MVSYRTKPAYRTAEHHLRHSLDDALDQAPDHFGYTPEDWRTIVEIAQDTWHNSDQPDFDAVKFDAVLSEFFPHEAGGNAIAPYADNHHANRSVFQERATKWLECHGADPAATYGPELHHARQLTADALYRSQEAQLRSVTADCSEAAAVTITAAARHAAVGVAEQHGPQRIMDPEESPRYHDDYASFVNDLAYYIKQAPAYPNDTDRQALDRAIFARNWPEPDYNYEGCLDDLHQAARQFARECLENLEVKLQSDGALSADDVQAINAIRALQPPTRHQLEHYQAAAERPWQENLCHYSGSAISRWDGLQENEPIQDQPYFKPNGFWFSVTGPHDWPQQVQSMGINHSLAEHHEVRLAPDANLLVLDSYEAIQAMRDEYSFVYQDTVTTDPHAIDWQRLSQDYDGVVVTSYLDLYAHHQVRAFRMWDANSGVIWRNDAIADVRHTGA